MPISNLFRFSSLPCLFTLISFPAAASSVLASENAYSNPGGQPLPGGIVPPFDYPTPGLSPYYSVGVTGTVTSTLPGSAGSFKGGYGHGESAAGLTTQYNPYLKIDSYLPDSSQSVGGVWVSSYAALSDTLTVNGGPSSGTFKFAYSLTGSATSTEGLQSSFYLDGIYLALNSTSLFNLSGSPTATLAATGYVTVPYTRGAGTLNLDLFAVLACPKVGYCNESLDVSHTLNIMGLQVLDSSGNPVNNASVTSDSGLNYLALPGLVDSSPEPASLGLIMAGGLMFVWRGVDHRGRQ